MIALIAEKFGWVMDMSGESLTIQTPQARRILEQLKDGKQYTVEIKLFRKRRSLDANGFYWKYLGLLAEALNVAKPYLHNVMLRRYGQMEMFDEQVAYTFLPDTDEAQDKADNAETYHLKPTSKVKDGNDGHRYRCWVLLRGSSTYDTKEMSTLIDGLVSECKMVGIEVLDDKERALLGR